MDKLLLFFFNMFIGNHTMGSNWNLTRRGWLGLCRLGWTGDGDGDDDDDDDVRPNKVERGLLSTSVCKGISTGSCDTNSHRPPCPLPPTGPITRR